MFLSILVLERPISEGRMRQNEMKANSYNATLVANISNINAVSNTNITTTSSKYMGATEKDNSSNPQNNSIMDELDKKTNPFYDDYDESKNPFTPNYEANSGNVFVDDYDKNLNPFET